MDSQKLHCEHSTVATPITTAQSSEQGKVKVNKSQETKVNGGIKDFFNLTKFN